ncbi:MAG: hypothetical protein Q9198_001014 [Flavoplaca austrocitrina]
MGICLYPLNQIEERRRSTGIVEAQLIRRRCFLQDYHQFGRPVLDVAYRGSQHRDPGFIQSRECSGQEPREVTLLLPNNATAKSLLFKMDGVTLKALIKADLKDQGIGVSIKKCKRSARSKRIRLWTTTVEEVPLLLEWKPNLPNCLGKGSRTWVRK